MLIRYLQNPVKLTYPFTHREYEAQCGTGGRLHVIALTAMSLSTDRDQALALGMDDYVIKVCFGKTRRLCLCSPDIRKAWQGLLHLVMCVRYRSASSLC